MTPPTDDVRKTIILLKEKKAAAHGPVLSEVRTVSTNMTTECVGHLQDDLNSLL